MENNKSVTAIEWLAKQYNLIGTEEHKQAKEMFEQQIIDAFKTGLINEMNGIEKISSEQYYNETFNK